MSKYRNHRTRAEIHTHLDSILQKSLRFAGDSHSAPISVLEGWAKEIENHAVAIRRRVRELDSPRTKPFIEDEKHGDHEAAG